MKWNRTLATVAGLALIVLTNAVALGGVAYNRQGQSQGTLRLSERELAVPAAFGAWNRESENSGLSLRLRWRSLPPLVPAQADQGLYADGGGHPGWLDDAKMQSLGFAPVARGQRFVDEVRSRDTRELPRDVLIVLELDGRAFQESLRRADARAIALEARNSNGKGRQDAAMVREHDQRIASRLFAVDAGLDRATLRARYPDRTMYAIVHGRIRPRWPAEIGPSGGTVDKIDADAVNVPLALRPVFDQPTPHFDATLVFGARAEPWLASASRR